MASGPRHLLGMGRGTTATGALEFERGAQGSLVSEDMGCPANYASLGSYSCATVPTADPNLYKVVASVHALRQFVEVPLRRVQELCKRLGQCQQTELRASNLRLRQREPVSAFWVSLLAIESGATPKTRRSSITFIDHFKKAIGSLPNRGAFEGFAKVLLWCGSFLGTAFPKGTSK